MAGPVEKFSINVETNLDDVYGKAVRSSKILDDLEKRKVKLEIDSARLDELRDKSQRAGLAIRELQNRIANIKANVDLSSMTRLEKEATKIEAEISKLTTQQNDIKLGTVKVDDAEKAVADLQTRINSLSKEQASVNVQLDKVQQADADVKNLQKQVLGIRDEKLAFDVEAQPIRTANVELNKTIREIDQINAKKIDIKVSDSLKNAGAQIQGLGDKMMSAVNPISKRFSDAFGVGAAVKGVDMAFNKIGSSVGGAVQRMDTLNNFPKMMSNMNISAKDSKQAINQLAKGIQGLPTSLDAGVGAVANFTSKNNDVKKSTDIFLGLNDAIVAGGRSSEIQSTALEQISQSYAKGKPDMVEWRSLMTAMPAQLNQVAKAMHFKDADALGESLRNGNTSMDDFMNTIVKLDKQGGAGFQSFSKQARNATDGLQTGMANLDLAIQRGVANILGSIDKMLKDIGAGGIGQVMAKVGKAFENALTYIGTTIEKNKGYIQDFAKFLGDTFGNMDFKSFFDGFVEGLKMMGNVVKGVITVLKPFFALFQNEGTAKTLGMLIPLWITGAKALQLFGGGLKIAGSAVSAGNKLLEFFGVASKMKMPAIFERWTSIFGKKKGAETGGELPMQKISVESIKSLGVKLATLAGLAGTLLIAGKALQEIGKINTKGIYEKMADVALAIGGMGLIMVAIDKLMQVAKTGLRGVATVIGLAGSIYILAKAMQEVGDVSGDFVGLQARLGSMALAVVEMGAFATAVGAVTTIAGGFMAVGVGAIVGLTTAILAVAGEFKLITMLNLDAKAIKRNVDAVKQGLDAILSMGSEVGFGDVLNGIKGLFMNVINMGLVTQILILAGEFKLLSLIKLNPSTIQKNIDAMKEALQTIATLNDGDGQNLIDKAWDFIENIVNLGIVAEIVGLAGELAVLQNIGLNAEKINDAIVNIKSAIKKIAEINAEDESNLIAKSWDFIENIVNLGIIGEIIGIAGELSTLQNIKLDADAIGESLATIKSAIKSVGAMANDEAFANGFDGVMELFNSFIEGGIIGNIVNIANQLATIQGLQLDSDAIGGAISAIKGAIVNIASIVNMDAFANGIDGVVDFFNTFMEANIIGQIVRVANQLSEIQGLGLDPDAISTSILAIKNAIGNIGSIMTMDAFASGLDGIIDFFNSFMEANIIGQIVNIANQLLTIQTLGLDPDTIGEAMTAIKSSISQIASITQDDAFSDGIDGIVDFFNSFIQSGIVGNFVNIATQLMQIQGLGLDASKLIPQVKAVKDAIKQISGGDDDGFWSKVGQAISSMVDSSSLSTMVGTVRNYYSIGVELKKIQGLGLDKGVVTNQLTTIQNALRSISGFATGNIVSNLNGIANALKALIRQLTQVYPPQFQDLGRLLAKKMNAGFRSVLNFASAVNAKMHDISTSSASSAGRRLASSLNSGFRNNLALGEAVENSIRQALGKNYSTTIHVNAESSGLPSTVMATGGLVNSPVGAYRLQDSPEHPTLMNGEFVVPAKVVDALGVPFFQDLIHGGASKTFNALGNAVSSVSNSVVNNTYNNNTDNRSYNMQVAQVPNNIGINVRGL